MGGGGAGRAEEGKVGWEIDCRDEWARVWLSRPSIQVTGMIFLVLTQRAVPAGAGWGGSGSAQADRCLLFRFPE